VLTSTYEARLVRASAFLGHVALLWPIPGPCVALTALASAAIDLWSVGSRHVGGAAAAFAHMPTALDNE